MFTGYSSDTEDCTQKCQESSLSDINAAYQTSKVGILATPRITRPQFSRKTNSKTNQNKNLSLGKKNPKHDKGMCGSQEERYQEIGPQCVQNEPQDWHSCSEISASSSFVGFYSCNKSKKDAASYSEIEIGQTNLLRRNDGDVELMKSNDQGLQTNCLLGQEAGKDNSNNCIVERCRVQGQSLKSFAALYVGEICEVALSVLFKERSKEFAKEYVANVIRLANCKVTQLEKSKSQTEKYHLEEQDTDMVMDEIENPSFSKVWKNSGVFSAKTPESHQGNDSATRGQGVDTNSKSREEGEVKDKNDFQFEEFLEKKMVDSLEFSGDDPTFSSSNSSRQSIDLVMRENVESSLNNPECDDFNNKLAAECTQLKKAVKDIQTSKEIKCAKRNELSTGNFDMEMKETTFQENEEMELEENGKNENVTLINDALKNVGGLLSNSQASENTNHYKNEEMSCSTQRNAEGCQDAITNFKPEGDDTEPSVSCISKNAMPDNSGSCNPEIGEDSEKLLCLAMEKQLKDNIDNCFRQRAPYKRTMSESQASERKQWSPLESGDDGFSFHSSAISCMAVPKYVRSASCPVVSEVRYK